LPPPVTFVQSAERQSAFWQTRIDCLDSKRQHSPPACGPSFDVLNARVARGEKKDEGGLTV
jgi:hypothetical protein